jgi:hypothetical protein
VRPRSSRGRAARDRGDGRVCATARRTLRRSRGRVGDLQRTGELSPGGVRSRIISTREGQALHHARIHGRGARPSRAPTRSTPTATASPQTSA